MKAAKGKKHLVNPLSVFVMILPVLVGVYLVSEKLVWNITDSVNHRLGYLSGHEVGKGDYVYFDFSHPFIKAGSKVQLTKRVACVAGETVTTVNRDVFCNGVFMGKALDKTASGKPLRVFVLEGLIPQGQVMVMGDSQDSFDSRYFGLVSLAELQKVIPLI